ncbi:hypothetical protein K439DRAFT_167899 [Ramaria rubella]|nr:hypothetical protein K439DRAFT_167899 [Ramaria rubella]
MQPAILIISNPVSGDGKGREFVQNHVIPLVQNLQYELKETIGAGTAGSLAAEFLQQRQDSNSTVVLVISGGDGTVHEVINGIGVSSRPLQLVICPQGTANALYSSLFPLHSDQLPTPEYRLRSLHAFLQGRTRALTLTQIRFFDTGGHITQTIFGIVVTSTALHAAILNTAENLRASIQGIERFKVAAAENMTQWYRGHVRLLSTSIEPALIYDPILGTFEPIGTADLELRGPFSYILSTTNVDRLEPAFEITPLFNKLPPGLREMDLIVVRPLQDPLLDHDTPESRKAFVPKLQAIFQGAYAQGGHVKLRYQDGTVGIGGSGPLIVEYVRCSGWEWWPVIDDEPAHLVCVDGTILKIPKGGKAVCDILHDPAELHYLVCA